MSAPSDRPRAVPRRSAQRPFTWLGNWLVGVFFVHQAACLRASCGSSKVLLPRRPVPGISRPLHYAPAAPAEVTYELATSKHAQEIDQLFGQADDAAKHNLAIPEASTRLQKVQEIIEKKGFFVASHMQKPFGFLQASILDDSETTEHIMQMLHPNGQEPIQVFKRLRYLRFPTEGFSEKQFMYNPGKQVYYYVGSAYIQRNMRGHNHFAALVDTCLRHAGKELQQLVWEKAAKDGEMEVVFLFGQVKGTLDRHRKEITRFGEFLDEMLSSSCPIAHVQETWHFGFLSVKPDCETEVPGVASAVVYKICDDSKAPNARL